MTTVNYLTDLIPTETRGEIYAYTHLRSFLSLPLVCKLLLSEITNEFLKTRCYAYFQGLQSIPCFIEPLIECVDNPWPWILYSLSMEKVNEDLYPIAQKLAKASLPKFQAYIQKHIVQLRSQKANYESELARGLPLLDLARTSFRQSWTQGEQEELSRLEREHPDEFRQSQDIIDEIEFDIDESSLKDFLERAGIDALGKVMLKDLRPFLASQRTNHPVVLRSLELRYRRTVARVASSALAREIKDHQSHVEKLNQYLEHCPAFEQKLENGTATIYHHILCLLPHFKNWMALAQKIHGPLAEAASLRAIVNSLPDPWPQMIWQRLYQECGQNSQEPAWAENHFIEHIPAMGKILRALFGHSYSLVSNYASVRILNFNPMKHRTVIEKIAKQEPIFLHMHLKSPDLEKGREQLEKTATLEEGPSK